MANSQHAGVSKPTPPPIGIKPRCIMDSTRQSEIVNAMNRYINAKVEIPYEWFDELQDIQYRLYPDETG